MMSNVSNCLWTPQPRALVMALLLWGCGSGAMSPNEAPSTPSQPTNPTPTPQGGPTSAATIADLGTLGGSRGFAEAMDDSGNVVGESIRSDGLLAPTIWTAGGAKELPSLPGLVPGAAAATIARAFAVSGGIAAGSALASDGEFHAALWTLSNGTWASRDLGALGGNQGMCFAVTQSAAGVPMIVGAAADAAGHSQAFVAAGSAAIQALPVPSGTTLSYAYAVNRGGTIVGDITLGGSNSAVVWAPNGNGTWQTAVLLPKLSGYANSTARGVNDDGQIVGGATGASGRGHAVRWVASSSNSYQLIDDIGTIDGGDASASGINNRGQVVGTVTLANNASRAFVWDISGGIRDLGMLQGHDAAIGKAINDASPAQIVGLSFLSTNIQPRAVRWALVQ